jgi:hypothetical protein
VTLVAGVPVPAGLPVASDVEDRAGGVVRGSVGTRRTPGPVVGVTAAASTVETGVGIFGNGVGVLVGTAVLVGRGVFVGSGVLAATETGVCVAVDVGVMLLTGV